MHKKRRELLAYCKKRYTKNKTVYWWFWCAKCLVRGLLLRDKPTEDQTSCDILVLHPSEKSYRLKRKQKLIDKLRESGVNVAETIALNEKQIVRQNACYGPFSWGRIFRCYEGYANWLRKKYAPKIIITDRNGSVLSVFLKSRNEKDPVTFHLAHSVLTAQSSRFSMLDYDYYCIYGKSSYEHLKALPSSFGACQLVLGGSILFDEHFVAPAGSSDMPLLFLGMGPELESTPEALKIYSLVCDWQKQSGKKLYIRLHQRSKGEFWQSISQENLEILPNEPFQTSASRASLVLSSYTNAVVDAALLGRPVQLISSQEDEDYLQVETFFGNRAVDIDSLDKAINHHLANYQNSITACERFAKYHLEHGTQSVNYVTGTLLELLETGRITNTVNISSSNPS